MKKKNNHFLIAIFVFTVLIRLFFAFQSPDFSTNESYFNLRIINHIKSTGFPLTYDELSYGGREVIYPQLFHYLMVPFSLSSYLLKFILVLLASTTVIITYFISKHIVDKEEINLTVAVLASFLPIEIETTVSQFSMYSLLLPLLLLMFYLLMTLEKKRHIIYFIAAAFILPLLHPISFLFVFALLFYVVIAVAESMKIKKTVKEAIFFSTLTIILINFIIFKKALLIEGLSIITKNPSISMIGASQIELNILQYVYLLGIIPLFLGIMGIYLGIRKKDEHIFLLSSSILGIITLMLTGVITSRIGTLLLSPFMVVISSLAIKSILDYINITKFHIIRKQFFPILAVILVVITIIPSIITANASSHPSQATLDLKDLKKQIDSNTTIMSIPEEGSLITGITNCKNVMDENYILAPELMERMEDTLYVYNTWSESRALAYLHKYNVSYILFTENSREKYNINRLIYAEDRQCFEKEYETLYKIKC